MVATVNDILLVALVFVLGYLSAQSAHQGAVAPIVKYRFIPRTASETLAMSDDTLSEFGQLLFADAPTAPMPTAATATAVPASPTPAVNT